ncbi:Protein CFAP276, partial [Pseudolycoriella hygida]
IKRVRNLNYEPYLESEGNFRKNLPAPPKCEKDQHWFENLSPNHRLFYHQTLNSARHSVPFQPIVDIYPKDSLDFMLGSVYNHSLDIFNSKTEIAYHEETIRQKERRLRNTRDLSPKRKIAIGHPLAIGGVKERLHPNSMKLMCSGHHQPSANKGYSRQDADGNVFNY